MTPNSAPTLLTAPFGDAAWDALVTLVKATRAGDALAPVTLCVPSAAAGTAVRRRLAGALGGGVANVSCTSLTELADRLAAPALSRQGRLPLGPVVATEAVRAALVEEGGTGPFGAVAENLATVAALTATSRDLGSLDAAALDRLAALGARQAAVARLHRRADGLLRTRWAGEQERLALAAAELADGRGALDEIGTVVLYLPRRVRAGEVALLEALARRHRLAAVVGLAGAADADQPAGAVLAVLERLLGPAHEVPASGSPPAAAPSATAGTADVVVRAPDPAEEVRVAVRMLVAALAEGVPAERIAIVARVAEPYGLLVHEELAAAGIAHSAPAGATLAQTTAGRTLLGVLALPDGNFRRADVLAWLRSAPIRHGARVAPAALWDRLAREAGIAGGPAQWAQRLERAREKRESVLRWRAAQDPAPDAPRLPGQPEQALSQQAIADDTKLTELGELAAFVAELVKAVEPGQHTGWHALAEWAGSLLDRYLGGADVVSWPDDDQRACARVRDVLAALGGLDGLGIGPAPDTTTFRHVLTQALDQPAPRIGTMGRGVLVGRPSDLVGGDVDLLLVLGMAEGLYPPRPVDDPLLPDRERMVLGLDRRGTERAEEHRDHLAALAAARRRVLCFARADPRAQRERQPSRWLLDACARRWGKASVYSDDLALLRHERAPWFVDVESFEWWHTTGRPPATIHDHDVSSLVGVRRAGLPLDRAAVVRTEPVLARGLGAVVDRQRGRFGPWTGSVGHRPGFLAEWEHPQSATGLETWATCPFRYLLGKVLGIAALDDPAEADEISPIDRGSLVHEVLEQFVGERLGRPADQPWTDEDRAALGRIADGVAARYQSEGRTGRALLWRLRWAQLRQHLDRLLTADDEQRRALGVVPHAVELGFGFRDDQVGPVVVDAGGGRQVSFRGRVDRIDLSPDGSRALVLDYKTANARNYPALAGGPDEIDLTGAGRHLQLLVYAEAARAATGAAEVDARFWFVRPGDTPEARGGPVDERARHRFRQVLTTVVDGVEHGRFPARPGDEGYFGFQNCAWCAFDRACPKSRGELWEGVRLSPELEDYLTLVQPPEEPTS